MERTTAGENMRICFVCNSNMKYDEPKARKIDGLWVCGSNCLSKFEKEKKKWTPEEWGGLCKMQASYEELKRAETGAPKDHSNINH